MKNAYNIRYILIDKSRIMGPYPTGVGIGLGRFLGWVHFGDSRQGDAQINWVCLREKALPLLETNTGINSVALVVQSFAADHQSNSIQ